MKSKAPFIFGLAGCLLIAGCHTDMWVQPKLKAQHESDLFADKMVSRPRVEGTVARGLDKLDDGYYLGRNSGKLVEEIPVQKAMVELKLKDMKSFLKRGQERFNVYCSPCHGATGEGNGMITQRGLALRKKPASYHTDRLRKMPAGHFFDVITHGFGIMYSYAARVDVPDRWAIAAYIRALQLSQSADPTKLTAEDLAKMESAPVSKENSSER